MVELLGRASARRAYDQYRAFARGRQAPRACWSAGTSSRRRPRRDDGPRPRRRDARHRRALRRGQGGARRLLPPRVRVAGRCARLGGQDPGRRARRRSRSGRSTSIRRRCSCEVRAAHLRRRQSGVGRSARRGERRRCAPRRCRSWVALFDELGKADPSVVGHASSTRRADAKVVRVRRRRAHRHRRPVRRDEGAARRRLHHRAPRPRRGDPHRGARPAGGARLDRDPARLQ